MLSLKNITKDYQMGETKVEALRGISIDFRESEFVSILGPSGCGKTTFLNIIGGLDVYTSGDLSINGVSTKKYKDRDWDTYRNHSIGFVFQSYNLIPHQSVLRNVELALTLSGVSKAERKKRAKEALAAVGLESQMEKRPSEMSGGQMQRVAIARALVNNPDIILADEPTGALDTETSIQVMKILKEVSKDRLVIMVTHNPALAQEYSTRVIRMLDGVVVDDSQPLSKEEKAKISQKTDIADFDKRKKTKKPSMSFATAFGLSLKNLFTKKGRTALTAFAGSIGIIGIALIFSVSKGTTNYIQDVQEDTLSSYPLTLEARHVDLGSLLQSFIGATQSKTEHENDAIYQKSVVYNLIHSISNVETKKNDLKSFKEYIEAKRNDPSEENEIRDAISGIQYSYDLDMLVYTKNSDGQVILSDTTKLLQELVAEYMGPTFSAMMSSSDSSASAMSNMFGSSANSNLWQEMLCGDNGETVNPILKKQYDLIYGSWPSEYNEVVLVLDENNELDDMTLYALGLKSHEDVVAAMKAAVNEEDFSLPSQSWNYEEICNMDFRVVLNADCFVLDEASGLYTDLRDTDAGLKYLYDNGITLRVSGIIRPNPDAVSTMLTGSIAYTSELTKFVIEKAYNSSAVIAQKLNPSADIFSGLPFKETGDLDIAQKEKRFREYVDALTLQEKADCYMQIKSIPSEEYIRQMADQILQNMSRQDMESAILSALSQQMGMSVNEISAYISSLSDSDLQSIFLENLAQKLQDQYAEEIQKQMQAMSSAQLADALSLELLTYTSEQCADFYDKIIVFSDSSYEENLIKLGCLDLSSPSGIHLFASTFAGKDTIKDAIASYNNEVDDFSKIAYTDYVGLMMSSITTIINAITYVLIAFVAVSLIVSSIMIGVITLISVQERTKEIGILRAIGASKRDVSSMFNAETVIIGFCSGLLGVVITMLLCIPINAILYSLTNIKNLNATLPLPAAAVLILISTALTLFSGLIPSRSAAKKDPVVALRSE